MTTKMRSRAAATSKAVNAPLEQRTKTAAPDLRPRIENIKFVYRLEPFTVERLKDGWWIRSDAVKKQGPFATPQDICIAIARWQCALLSNRHHSLTSFHGVKRDDPFFGLPDLPALCAKCEEQGS